MLEVDRILVRRNAAFTLDIPALVVQPHTILGLTGPNGSGKTTLIDCLAGLTRPDRGEVRIAGQKVHTQRQFTAACIGLTPDDENWFVKELTAREYLGVMIRTYRKAGVTANIEQRVSQLATRLHFNAFDYQLEQLSHGNKKKVQLIAALMHTPPVLIIDELRNGLDPLAIIVAEQLVREPAEAGACIVAATHDLWWAERMADEIVLLIQGAVAHHQPTSRIIREYGSLERLFTEIVQV